MKRTLLNLACRLSAPFGVSVLEGSPPQRVMQLVDRLRPEYPPEDLIRIGGNRDGGYLVPPDIDQYDLLISPGVGPSYDFDRHFFEQNIDTVMIDRTVDVPSEPHMVHLKKFLAGYSSEEDGFVTLEDLVEQYGEGKSRIALQMDIEGAEYEVLAATPQQVLTRFGLIVLEAHHLSGLCYRGMFPLLETAFSRILKDHFVAHIHVNNSARVVPYGSLRIPDTMEFTFLHRGMYRRSAGSFRSPHSLDFPSIPGLPELPLPRCWW